MDQRIYVDTVENSLSYVTSGGVILAQAGEVSYQGWQGDTERKRNQYCRKKDDVFYVSLSFIKEHASCSYKTYQNPKTPCDYVRPECILYDGVTDGRYSCKKVLNKKYKYFVELAKASAYLWRRTRKRRMIIRQLLHRMELPVMYRATACRGRKRRLGNLTKNRNLYSVKDKRTGMFRLASGNE